MSEGTNPRFQLRGEPFKRLFALFDLAEKKEGRIADVILLLGNFFPAGTRRDLLGATASQTAYLGLLAGLDDEEQDDLARTFLEVGGISSAQADHLIRRLKYVLNRE